MTALPPVLEMRDIGAVARRLRDEAHPGAATAALGPCVWYPRSAEYWSVAITFLAREPHADDDRLHDMIILRLGERTAAPEDDPFIAEAMRAGAIVLWIQRPDQLTLAEGRIKRLELAKKLRRSFGNVLLFDSEIQHADYVAEHWPSKFAADIAAQVRRELTAS